MMSARAFILACLATLALAMAVRVVWLRADPPVVGGVGIVWHDEGAWVHNARNRALWGTWRTDNWNPIYVAPVFTALEYAAFEAFGVGTWQARVVPAVSGLLSVGFLVAGLTTLVGRRLAVVGGLLLAVNYAFIMWNRAALMESTMTMWMVAAWAAYARAEQRPSWAIVSGVAATAAWFTKAAAAFFVAALAVEAAWAFMASTRRPATRATRTSALFVLLGLAASFAVAGAVFVLPHWDEYAFYNWQMSVTRKPEYSVGALADRASWLPIVQSLFSRMWLELVAGSLGLMAIIATWWRARPAERLLVLWVALGLLELVVHDAGNERRYVMFIPAFIAAACVCAAGRPGDGIDGVLRPRLARGWFETAAVWPSMLALAYLVVGSALRPFFIADIEAGVLSNVVRLSGLVAVLVVAALALGRRRAFAWLVRPLLPPAALVTLAAVAIGAQTWQFMLWAGHRAETNYRAAVAVGQRLPEGTLVQGKLANGLSLESRIRPLFVGNGFGNFADRLRRDDARYILTYDLPRIGYESSDGSGLIQGILEQYPRRRIVDSFVVDETPLPDRAVLIDKFPDGEAGHARD